MRASEASRYTKAILEPIADKAYATLEKGLRVARRAHETGKPDDAADLMAAMTKLLHRLIEIKGILDSTDPDRVVADRVAVGATIDIDEVFHFTRKPKPRPRKKPAR